MGTDCRVRTMDAILEEIRRWCQNRDIKIQEFADALRVSRETAKRILYGKRSYLTTEEVEILAFLMNKPIAFFTPNDKKLEENGFLQSLKKRKPKSSAAETETEETHANNKLNKELTDAVEIIKEVTNIEKKEIYVQQVVLVARTAKMG